MDLGHTTVRAAVVVAILVVVGAVTTWVRTRRRRDAKRLVFPYAEVKQKIRAGETESVTAWRAPPKPHFQRVEGVEATDLISLVARRAGVSLATRARGTTQLVAFKDAPAFLDACAAEGVRVLGIEGFRVDASGVTPDMEAIADFSMPPGPGSVEDSIRASRTYLRAVKPDLMFEFVMDRPSPRLET